MQNRHVAHRLCFSLSALLISALFVTSFAFAQGAAFTYQGKLTDAGTSATGNYDMQFLLFDTLDVGTGTQQGSTIINTSVQVAGGLFTVQLDFGPGVFDGSPRYLEIGVRPTDSKNPYTTLSPRQPITATPYSVRSLNAAAADGLSVACVNCVTSSQIANVEGAQITGAIPVESVPTGSGAYIQNAVASARAGRPTVAQDGGFDLTGDGTLGGTLSANVVNTATQYNIAGTGVLSLGTGADNLFVGILAGQTNAGAQNSFFGRAAGKGNTTGFDNSSFGAFSGGQGNMTGSANSFFGVSAGFNTSTGSANMFFGRSAGFQNTTGNDNSFFGVQAGRDNGPGSQNSLFGRAAGVGNTTGFDNSSFGAFSGGQVNMTGSANSFFGVSAGFNTSTGTSNMFFGRSAGFQNTSGNDNSFFGVQAGRDNGTGIQNSFFGRAAGIGNANGSGNTIIGANANVGAGNLTNATAIGASTTVSQSNSLILGNNANVGIGTSAPTAKLHVVGTAKMNVLELTGGFDLAEHFEIADGATPGLVVAIDPQNTGRLSIARGAYNRRVAGIISGANNLSAGMTLAGVEQSRRSMPIALSGRVWVYCDATRHAIHPGDLLTTSNTAGHAMKVLSYTRAQGAVIGKAMTELKSGRGLVLALVSLQ